MWLSVCTVVFAMLSCAFVNTFKGIGHSKLGTRGISKLQRSSNQHEVQALDEGKWIKESFGKEVPCRLLLSRDDRLFGTESDRGCIINNPKTTMAKPFLGLNITDVSKLFRSVMMKEPSARSKPLLVSVRGTGGGKSRLFEEVRRELMKDDDVLPLGITFNSATPLVSGGEWIAGGNEESRAERTATVAILTRLACSFYGQDFDETRQSVREKLDRLTINFSAKKLLQEFTRLMKIQLRKAGHPVTGLVILVDETVRLSEVLLESFPTSLDPLAPLRGAILDQPNTALAISSLAVSIPGVSDSGSSVIPLPQPELLDPAEIVSKWWRINGTETEIFKYTCIAAIFADLPRAIECAYDYIKDNPQPIGDQSVRQLLAHVRTEMGYRYAKSTKILPRPALLHSAWFRTASAVDSEVADSIRRSLFTNVVQSYLQFGDKYYLPDIVPRVSLAVLALGDRSNSFSRVFLGVVDQILSGVERIPTSGSRATIKKAAGDLLEEQALLVLQARILVAMNAEVTTTTRELLGLDNYYYNIPALDCTLHLDPTMIAFVAKSNLALHCTSDIPVDEKDPIQLRRSAKGDSFDLLMKVYDATARAGCRYIFMDQKPRQETARARKKKEIDISTVAQLPKKGAQYLHIHSVMTNHSMTEEYAYVYQATRSNKQSFGERGQRWACYGHQQAEDFFGPVWVLYQALRACWDKK